MNLENLRAVLERAGVQFEAGLSPDEIARAEKRFGFTFPDDLRALLMFALPAGLRFPNWRNLDDPELARSLSWPLEGIWFDVQNNQFWPSEWGAKPDNEAAAYEELRRRVTSAPRLIPIYGHRYMPDRPHTSGNPVLSVYQTDIICFGTDLGNYLHNEFHDFFGTPPHNVTSEVREIAFWSLFIDGGHQ
jgi:hypothetical protein